MMIVKSRLCSKLRFKFVHLPGAEVGKCVHPEFKSCVNRLRYTLNNRENGGHVECTALTRNQEILRWIVYGY